MRFAEVANVVSRRWSEEPVMGVRFPPSAPRLITASEFAYKLNFTVTMNRTGYRVG